MFSIIKSCQENCKLRSWATLKCFAGRMWSAGKTLPRPVMKDAYWLSETFPLRIFKLSFRSKTSYNQFFYRFCRFCKIWFGSRSRFFSHLQDVHNFKTTEAYIEAIASLPEVEFFSLIQFFDF
jgi:hypothetical protein